jgi:hypothetical protein
MKIYLDDLAVKSQLAAMINPAAGGCIAGSSAP